MSGGEGVFAPRSLLFVPALQAGQLLAKVPRWSPDAVVVDLEDSVLAGQKDEAREVMVQAVRDGSPPSPIATLVRVNAPGSPWYEADVQAAVRAGASGVVLPKYETAEQYRSLRQALDGAGAVRYRIVVGLETVLGVADARELLAEGPDAAYFGAEDYVSDLGGGRSESNLEVLYARSQCAVAGRLAGCLMLDQAVVAVRDRKRFEQEALEARRLGYRGKICIHPDQVALADTAFSPSADEVAWAEAVLGAGAAGAELVDGNMVDEVHRRMARRVLEGINRDHQGESL
jgi:citrate lyase subunit beta/citryl-CoA lyase